jgi:RimJ/RimL family protein N-acetyltransferase
MIEKASLIFYLLWESIRNKALIKFMNDQVFIARVVVPVRFDLTKARNQQNHLSELGYRFIEINIDDLRKKKWYFPIRSRYFNAINYIKRGLRGFLLIKDNEVIGDIWCIAPHNQNTPIRYVDLEILGINCVNRDAYALGIFINPDYRGINLAVPFHQELQATLKKEGWQRIYAYYYEDNIPSRWMHLMLNCEELPKLKLSRFFRIIKTYHKNQPYLKTK